MDTEIQSPGIIDANSIIGDDKDFLDSRSLFIHCYQQPPSMMWVDKTDNKKILEYIKKEYGDAIGGILPVFRIQQKEESHRILPDDCPAGG